MSSGKEFVSSSSTQSSSSSCNGSIASSTEQEFAECSLPCSNMHMTDLEHISFSIKGR